MELICIDPINGHPIVTTFFFKKKHKQIETNFLNEFHILNGTKKNRMFARQTDLNYIN